VKQDSPERYEQSHKQVSHCASPEESVLGEDDHACESDLGFKFLCSRSQSAIVSLRTRGNSPEGCRNENSKTGHQPDRRAKRLLVREGNEDSSVCYEKRVEALNSC